MVVGNAHGGGRFFRQGVEAKAAKKDAAKRIHLLEKVQYGRTAFRAHGTGFVGFRVAFWSSDQALESEDEAVHF